LWLKRHQANAFRNNAPALAMAWQFYLCGRPKPNVFDDFLHMTSCFKKKEETMD
jgi:hypothetical protein